MDLPDGTVLFPPPDGRAARPSFPEGYYVRPGDSLEGAPVKKLSWTHKLAIDLMIQHPEWTSRELGQFFGHSDSWVSMVVNSDAFQAKLAERREEVLNPAIRASIEERFRNLAATSLDRLQTKLANPNVSERTVLASVELSIKALGLGARPAAGPQVQVAIIVPQKGSV